MADNPFDQFDAPTGGNPFDQFDEAPSDVGLVESFRRGAGSAATGTGEFFGKLLGVPAILGDAANSVYSGKPESGLQDAYFRNMVDPTVAQKAQFDINPQKETQGLPAQLAGAAGHLGVDLPTMMLGGAGAEAAKPTASLVDLIGNALMHSGNATLVPGAASAGNLSSEVLDKGGSGSQALGAGAANFLTQVLLNQGPLSAAGNLPVRLATGAGYGAAGAEVGRQVNNLTTPDSMQQPFSIAGPLIGALQGGAMGGVLGERAPNVQPAARVTDLVNKFTEANPAPDPATVAASAVTDEQTGQPAQSPIPAAVSKSTPTPATPLDNVAPAPPPSIADVAPTAAKSVEVTPTQEANPAYSAASSDRQNPRAPDPASVPPIDPAARHAANIEDFMSKVPNATPEQAQAMRANAPPVTTDRVTGLYRSEELMPTLAAAQASGQPSSYIEIDLRNVGGLNAASGSSSVADNHIRAAADIIKQTTGRNAVAVRKGGDEIGVVMQGTPPEQAHQIAKVAQQRVEDYAAANGLSNIPHPKGGQPGFGIHYGVSEITPDRPISETIRSADTLVEARKAGASYEQPGQNDALGNGALDQRPEGRASEGIIGGTRQAGDQTSAGESIQNTASAAKPETPAEITQGTLFRQGEAPEQGTTLARARNVISNEFGTDALSKLEANGLHLTPNSELPKIAADLRPDQHAGVKGATLESGDVHVFPENHVHPRDVLTTVVHEAVHKALPTDTVDRLAGSIEAAAKESPKIQKSLDAIPADTPPEHRSQEVVAQTLGDLYNQPIGRRVLNQVKLSLVDLGVPMKWLNANEAVLREIGVQNLRAWTDGDYRTFTTPGSGAVTENRKPSQDESPVTSTEAPVSAEKEPQTAPVVENSASTTEPEKERTTGIKNEVTKNERAARGLDEVDVEGKRKFGDVWDNARYDLAKNPRSGEELAQSIVDKPRPLTAEESATLVQDRMRLHNEHHNAMDDVAKALSSGDELAEIGARVRLHSIEVAIERNDRASRLSGYEQGLGLAARRLMSQEDYSMASLVQRAKVALGAPELPEAVRAKLDDLASQLKAKETELAQRQAKIDELQSSKTQTESGARRERKQVASTKRDIIAEIARLAGKPEPAAQFAREGTKYDALIRKLARALVEDGSTAGTLVDDVHSAVGDLTGMSKRQIADVISGYDKAPKQETQDILRSRLEAIRSELRRSSKAEDIEQGKIENPRDKARQADLRRQSAELQRRLETGDFSKVERVPPKYNDETKRIEGERDILKKRVDAEIRKLSFNNRSTWEKVGDFALTAQRAIILSGVHTIGKLTSAAGYRIATAPIEHGIGAGLSVLPGVRQVAKKAAFEGGFNVKAQSAALGQTFSADTIREMWSTLKYGHTSISAKHGGDNEFYSTADAGALGKAADLLELVGRIHGALKTPAKIHTYELSVIKRTDQAVRELVEQGATPADAVEMLHKPEFQAEIQAKAYADSQRTIFLNDNKLADGVTNMLRAALKKPGQTRTPGETGVELLKRAGHALLPIVKVPTNIVAETTSYAVGGAKALTQLVLAKGINNLTHDQADYIMRNLSKQTLGLALMAVGYCNSDSIGGYYDRDEFKKRNKNAPEFGGIRLLGVDLPRWVLHTPPLEMLQLGATLRKVFDKTRGSTVDKVAAAGAKGVDGIAEELPIFNTPFRLYSDIKDHGLGVAAGKFAASSTIPPDLARYAKERDNNTYRKPHGFVEAYKLSIPGERETVPRHW